MSETTPLIKAALNLRVGVGFDVYDKFVTEIAILHKKSGNETIFITAKNERLL